MGPRVMAAAHMPPFESQWREQQLAEAFTITLQQHPALQTLWLIVVQSLNKHVQNLHRDRGFAGARCGRGKCGPPVSL